MSISQMGWHDGNSVRFIKSFVVCLLPPSERSHGKGECSLWNPGCPFLVEGVLGSKNTPWEVLLLLILRPHRDAIPHAWHPLIPGKMTPTAPGSRAGMAHSAELVLRCSVGNTVEWTLLQRKSAGMPSFFPSTAWKTLPGFVYGSKARLNSLLLSLVGIGLVPRWGQGAGPQSKCCGCYCRRFARCFLCPCPPTTRVPFESSFPHCAFFSISYVATETRARPSLQLLCSPPALPGPPMNPEIAPPKQLSPDSPPGNTDWIFNWPIWKSKLEPCIPAQICQRNLLK